MSSFLPSGVRASPAGKSVTFLPSGDLVGRVIGVVSVSLAPSKANTRTLLLAAALA